ncbi:MAG TPA: hypothetical protein EYP67_03735 [Methanosarcinales archaeon]|nr:hypothetical protein [Methanosarcinales archaeon]
MTELIRKLLGWCPVKEQIRKEEQFMFSNENQTVTEIKSNKRIFLGVAHLALALYLISIALSVLSEPNTRMFPWWIMDINFVASGILLTIGIISLVMSFGFVKRDDSYNNICKILALASIGLAIAFFAYLHQYMARIWYSGATVLIRGPLSNYTFDLGTLIAYSALIALPALMSLLALFRSPRGSYIPDAGKKSYLTLAITIVLVAATTLGLGIYYNHLNQQKASMVVEEFGKNREIKLYELNDDFVAGTWMDGQDISHFIDSKKSTSGRFVSQDTYDAIRFLEDVDAVAVMAWWDPALEIEAAGKTPVICYASEKIEHTVARPTSIDEFEPDEKVADVARFFVTDSVEEAKDISEEYGTTIAYLPRYYGPGLFWAMTEALDPKLEVSSQSEFGQLYEQSMYHRMITCSDPEPFERIFENDDVCIYRLE